MTEGWIKLHRKFEDWEWFNTPNMVHLFIYLLLKANHEDATWKGIKIKRGQILTGRKQLSQNTKISEQTIRTCLKRLEKTEEINQQTNNQFSIITICKYDDYQSEKILPNKRTNQRLTSDQPTTNHKQEEEEYKKEKNIESDAFKKFKKWLNENCPRVLKMENTFTEAEYENLKKDFTTDQIRVILESMQNWKPLLSKNTNANLTFRTWAKKEMNGKEKPKTESKIFQPITHD